MKMKKVVALSALLCLVASAAMAQDRPPPVPSIVVSGHGQIQAAPDLATVRVGIQSRASTAAEAQRTANETMQRLLQRTMALGVERKDIQTTQLSLYPTQEHQPGRPNEFRWIYIASNVVSVRLTNFELIGRVVDAAIESGANNIQGVDFSLQNDREAQAEALRQAVASARSRAEAIASALGVALGEPLEVQEGGAAMIPPPMPMMRGMAMEAGAGTPVEPGELTIRATVSIRFAIRRG
jgi:uncharacterized protein